MENKVRDFVYLDTNRYMSLDNLRVFYWGIIIIPFFMVVVGIVAIKLNGINWKSLFPLVSIAVWSLLYWIFVLTVQSKRTKKTFELRFLVNGILGFMLSSLMWIFVASFNLAATTPFLSFDFFLWILGFYLLFSLIYVIAIILCVHKGVFAWIKEKGKTKTALIISTVFGELIPVFAVLGMHSSRLMRAHASISTQYTVMTIITILMIFIPALAHINFVQYYYCKKYGINCDEHGNTTSPKLERGPSKSEIRKERKRALREYEMTAGGYQGVLTQPTESGQLEAEKSGAEAKAGEKQGKKRMPLILKILIGIVSVPILAFVITFIVFFMKAMIQDLS